MSAPRVRQWWSRLGRNYVSAEFVLFVDNLIESAPVSEDWLTITRWSDESTKQ
jgi:hypothetical protein